MSLTWKEILRECLFPLDWTQISHLFSFTLQLITRNEYLTLFPSHSAFIYLALEPVFSHFTVDGVVRGGGSSDAPAAGGAHRKDDQQGYPLPAELAALYAGKYLLDG